MATPLEFSKTAKKIARRKGRLVAPAGLLAAGDTSVSPVRPRIVDAILPESFLLKRRVEAPGAARKNLKALVELDMVRRTPFRQEEVYWAVSEPKKAGDKLAVTQWVAKRSEVEQLSGRLGKLGLQLRRVYVDDAQAIGPIADLSATVTPRAARWRQANALLAISALLLAGAIWLYPAWQASAELTRLNSDIASQRSEALQLRKEVDILRARETERAAFLDIVFLRPRLSHMLRDLTVALPDEVWISEMNFSQERLVVSGEIAGSAADLVLALSQRSEFTNPRLSGPVARAANGAERFELTLDIGAGQ